MADGKTVLTIIERCPQCGFEPPDKVERLADLLVKPETSLSALDHMAKIGLGVAKGVDVEEVQIKLLRSLEVITHRVAEPLAKEIVADLQAIWDN